MLNLAFQSTPSDVSLWSPRGVFNLVLIWFVCVSVPEQCVKTAYLPCWWERELGRVQKAWTNTTIPHSQYFLLLSRFPLFDLLCIYNFQSQPFLFFQLRIYLFFPLLLLPLISFALFFFVSLSSNTMPVCEKRLKHVLFCCHPSSALFCQLQKSCGYLGLVIISCGE